MNNYNQNNYYSNKKPLSHYLKNFLLTFLGFIILIFILLWLFPTKSSIKDSLTEALNPLYDRIYQENLNNMKEAAITYYTTERLPKTEGSSKKMTLEEMYEKHLLLEVTDRNGNMCDSHDSYVEITKDSKEYRMKVNLKCGSEEKYIIVYLGCYSYCDGDICEKKTGEKTKVITTKQTVIPTKPTTKKYYCQKVNGRYYDSNGKVVGKSTYEKSCEHKPTPTPKYYCKIVNGKYYDKNGKVVSKKAYEKSCNKPEPTPKYYCKIVNGKYYDKNGNIVSKDEYKSSCFPEPEKRYKYKYAKEQIIHHEKEYSKWTDWSEKIEYNPETDKIDWGKHETVWYEQLGSETKTVYQKDITKPIRQKVSVNTGETYKQYACEEYDYFYDTTTTTIYKTTGSNGGWSDLGTSTYSTIPTSTNTDKYVFVRMSYENCDTSSLCSVKPKYVFRHYRRSISTATTSETKTDSTLTAVCKKVVEKQIPIYATIDQTIAYDYTPVTKTIYYYHKKTRELIRDAYDEKYYDEKWSYSKNDEWLIKNGYKYTGIYIII